MVEGKPWKPAGGMGNYLMQSVFELLETVLSYLSNTISFLRVGAFVIVHASMMMVVFTLAGTPNNIVVVILGNLVVICSRRCSPPFRASVWSSTRCSAAATRAAAASS